MTKYGKIFERKNTVKMSDNNIKAQSFARIQRCFHGNFNPSNRVLENDEKYSFLKPFYSSFLGRRACFTIHFAFCFNQHITVKAY